jgi:hypothetical protein
MLVLEALLYAPEKDRTDIPCAREAAISWSKKFLRMKENFDKGHKIGTSMKLAVACAGKYWNAVKTWYFDIFLEP